MMLDHGTRPVHPDICRLVAFSGTRIDNINTKVEILWHCDIEITRNRQLVKNGGEIEHGQVPR